MPRFDLMIAGHVTRDEIGGEIRLGGAASFAARAASALGLRAAVITAAPPGWPPLAELQALPGLTIEAVASPAVTTFALDYSGPRRRLFLRDVARPLAAADVPASFRDATVAYVGPVAGECDGAFVASLGAQPFVCLGLQGWLRRRGPDNEVLPDEGSDLARPPVNLRLASLSEEDHPRADGVASALASTGCAVAVTRGSRGATLLVGGAALAISAVPTIEVDPTGAGDVFALVLAWGLARGLTPTEAGHQAAVAAARVVEGPGIGRLGARLEA